MRGHRRGGGGGRRGYRGSYYGGYPIVTYVADMETESVPQTPEQEYAKYLSWFNGQYGKTKKPMPYDQWLKWAASKNKVYAADAKAETAQKISVEINKKISYSIYGIVMGAVVGMIIATVAGKGTLRFAIIGAVGGGVLGRVVAPKVITIKPETK